MYFDFIDCEEFDAICKIHSVGDGFCYSGKIYPNSHHPYTFMIDCGNMPPGSTCIAPVSTKCRNNSACKLRLEDVIDHMEHVDCLDLFILTHLHKDHFSGISYLFKKYPPKKVVLPYLYPVERLKLILQADFTDIESMMFLADPYGQLISYLKEANTEEVEINLIRGNPNNKAEMMVNEEIDIYINENIEGSNTYKVLINQYSNNIYYVNDYWYFKFFNLEGNSKELLLLKEQIPNLDAQELKKIVTDPSLLKNYQKKYKYIMNSYGWDLNNSSLVIYHGSTTKLNTYKSGTLITGDINLKRRKPKSVSCSIRQFFSNEWSCIGMFSLPHHGSKDNWNKDIIKNLGDSICFASTHSYYLNRVEPKMMSDLRCSNIQTWIVDENKATELYQLISPNHDKSLCLSLYSHIHGM